MFWRRGVALMVVVAVLLAGDAGLAQAPAAEEGSYNRTVWRATDGLPEDTVQALAEAADGQLWVGTTGGVSVFDGAHLHAFRSPVSLEVNSAFCVLAEANGDVWVGLEGGGLLRASGQGAKLYSAAEGLADGFVRAVYRDAEGRLWVGTDEGLFRLRGERFERVDGRGTVPRIAVHALREDREHRLWVGGSELLSVAQNGDVTRYKLPWAYSQSRVKSVVQTRDGTVWVGTVGGLARLAGGKFAAVGGLHATVRTMLQTREGTLWIGTIGSGLWRYDGAAFAPVSPPGLLPSDTILSLFEDESGQLWIGTQSGLVRLNATPVHLVRLPLAADPDFETIAGDRDGVVHVAAQQMYRIEGGEARREPLPMLPAGIRVRNVFRARDGSLWVGTDGSGAYRVGANRAVTHYSAPGELTNNFVRAFLESRDGTVWIATDEGLSAVGAEGARKLTQADGLAYFSTRCLLEDRGGTLWIGTDRGLSAWKGGRFEQNAVTRALAREKIWSILEDSRGALWFGTRDHGIFRASGGTMEQITTEQGLPSNSVYQMLEDKRGRIWISSPNAISSMDAGAGDASGERALAVTTYSMPFGAEDAQLYGGRQPAGFVARDDSVWFPTTRGVARVEAPATAAAAARLRAVVVSVVEDGREVPLVGDVAVGAGVTRLSFQFAAIGLQPRTNVRFRFRLDGLDREWVAAGTAESATYTNLKPGHYVFRVQAFEAGQPSTLSEASVGLTKNRHFYQTWWFLLLCVAAAVVMAWSAYQVRMRQVRTRFTAVLQERTRLAREIHDTVIQGCTGLSAVLEAMAIEASSGATQGSELLDYARTQARGVIGEARQAVWDMRAEKEEQVDFAHALEALAKQTMREHRAVVVEVRCAAAAPLEPAVHHEAIMIVREAVGNALQHSGTDRIVIAVDAVGSGLEVSVRDFGCGIEAEQKEHPRPGHFGLTGMRERARRLGVELEVERMGAAQGGGTEVRFRLTERAAKRRRTAA